MEICASKEKDSSVGRPLVGWPVGTGEGEGEREGQNQTVACLSQV